MGPLSVLSICITCNLGLITMCGMVVNGWVKNARVDKLEAEVDKLWEKATKIEHLESQIGDIKTDIREIKDILTRSH